MAKFRYSNSALGLKEWNARRSADVPLKTGKEEASIDTGSVKRHGKPWLHVSGAMKNQGKLISDLIARHQIKKLNIAGSRESKEPGIYEWVRLVLAKALFATQD